MQSGHSDPPCETFDLVQTLGGMCGPCARQSNPFAARSVTDPNLPQRDSRTAVSEPIPPHETEHSRRRTGLSDEVIWRDRLAPCLCSYPILACGESPRSESGRQRTASLAVHDDVRVKAARFVRPAERAWRPLGLGMR